MLEHDRAEFIEGVDGVDVGAAVQQPLDHLGMAAVGGEEQRGGLVPIAGVDVGPLVERLGDPRDVSRPRGRPELLVECGSP